MTNCENRKLRKSLFEGYFSRAGKSTTMLSGTSNTEVIKNLVFYRKKQAEFFGYKNFAEMQIENKAAGSLENVCDLLEK
jgi:Zn-dependent oligopeptidase